MLDNWRRRGVVPTARHDLTITRVRPLDTLHRPAWSSLNCSVLYTDVAGFSAPVRTEADRQVVRDRLYDLLRGAFADSGVSWAACYHEDRGDGALVIVPPEVPTRAVADPLLALLAAELRRHNRRAAAPVRIQLRAALHVGPVSRDAEGLNGDAIIHTARMLDAPPLREALRAAEADLAFMASAHVYETALRSDAGLLDPATFTQVSFRVKESQITAWMHVAGSRPGTAVAEAAPPPDTGRPPSPITHFHDQVNVDGDFVIGTKFVDRARPPVNRT
ncbi:hypothetical protein FB559_4753 [Actinoallomurus bryophytorum]|uniref:Guanylate cyclase domain-containing protein n=1 Tax=Actinoallomurus bryophytorum TaxID=1490222 RepID=A0A543CQ91_9ACTN|nr:hypothetical protein [Actinoallomurus bryophytorum]TQL99097.1 hypothetical protein FB559_4753 [Actinoallomurus bryophytorum]